MSFSFHNKLLYNMLMTHHVIPHISHLKFYFHHLILKN